MGKQHENARKHVPIYTVLLNGRCCIFGILITLIAACVLSVMLSNTTRLDRSALHVPLYFQPYTDQHVPHDSRAEFAARMSDNNNIQLAKYEPNHQLRICMITADIPKSSSAGGTSTAIYLLAKQLAGMPSMNVTIIGAVHPDLQICRRAQQSYSPDTNITLQCLQQEHIRDDDGRILNAVHVFDTVNHALVKWWRQYGHDNCDVVHAHEWGGIASALSSVMQLDATRRVKLIVHPHGGHQWSQQIDGGASVSMNSLYIDNAERGSIERADMVASPSRYMLSYLSARGWHIQYPMHIPNIVEHAVAPSSDFTFTKVWRIAFIGRLEERKGIHILVEALNELHNKVLQNTVELPHAFEVSFIGSSTMFQGRSMGSILRERTANWTWPVQLHFDIQRARALQIIQQPGVLLVIPSLLENVPFAVTEAVQLGLPFITYNTGGVRELLKVNPQDEDTLQPVLNASQLANVIQRVITRGWHWKSQLHTTLSTAAGQWSHWHTKYAAAQQINKQPALNHAQRHAFSTVLYNDTTSGMELYTRVCDSGMLPGNRNNDKSDNELVLLLHDDFIPVDNQRLVATIGRLFNAAAQDVQYQHVGGMTFGVRMNNESYSYGHAPSYILYTRDVYTCHIHVPMIVRKHVFCSTYAAESNVFTSIATWQIALLMRQQRYELITYPAVHFTARHAVSGNKPWRHDCDVHTPPIERTLTTTQVHMLQSHVDDAMRATYHASRATGKKLIAHLQHDMLLSQHHREHAAIAFDKMSLNGWKLGGVTADNNTHWLQWSSREQAYTCAHSISAPFVTYGPMSFQPCISAEHTNTCCGSASARLFARYTLTGRIPAFTTRLSIELSVDGRHACGDGVRVSMLYRTTTSETTTLAQIDTAIRKRYKTFNHDIYDVFEDGYIDVVIDPLGSDECDLLDINISIYAQT